jgi:hypothetical protein
MYHTNLQACTENELEKFIELVQEELSEKMRALKEGIDYLQSRVAHLTVLLV